MQLHKFVPRIPARGEAQCLLLGERRGRDWQGMQGGQSQVLRCAAAFTCLSAVLLGMLPLAHPPLSCAHKQEALCGPVGSATAAWQRVRAACGGTAAALEQAVGGTAMSTLLPPQHMFSIYVHAPPDYKGRPSLS